MWILGLKGLKEQVKEYILVAQLLGGPPSH